MNKLLDTQHHRRMNTILIRLLERNGATYGVIADVMINELVHIHPIDVQLLLEWMVREAYLNADNGVYHLNHTEENDKLFKECLDY